MLPARRIVVGQDDRFLDRRADQRGRVLLLPLAGTGGVRRSRQPQGPERVTIFLALDDEHARLLGELRQAVRNSAHAVHVPDPTALTVWASLQKILRLES